MKLTQKLLSYLHRAFSKDPVQFLALRLRYDGGMTWAVEDARLTTVVTGGTGAALDVDLGLYSIAELVDFLRDQPGYSIEFEVLTEASTLSARILIDSANDQDKSNGDHLYAYTSLTWAYLEANAFELAAAREQIYQMLRQMSVSTGENEWLDEIGGYYNVPRSNNEPDSVYGPRIIYEVIRPRNNNKAIELAITEATGGASAKVTDVVIPGSIFPIYDGSIVHNGTYKYNASGKYTRNLFDVEYAFDLEGAEDIGPFQQRVLELIDRFRSAGTHLRQILLTGSDLVDTVTLLNTDDLLINPDLTVEDDIIYPNAGDNAEDLIAVSVAATFVDDAVTSDDNFCVVYVSRHSYDGQHTHGGSGRQLQYNSGMVAYDGNCEPLVLDGSWTLNGQYKLNGTKGAA